MLEHLSAWWCLPTCVVLSRHTGGYFNARRAYVTRVTGSIWILCPFRDSYDMGYYVKSHVTENSVHSTHNSCLLPSIGHGSLRKAKVCEHSAQTPLNIRARKQISWDFVRGNFPGIRFPNLSIWTRGYLLRTTNWPQERLSAIPPSSQVGQSSTAPVVTQSTMRDNERVIQMLPGLPPKTAGPWY